MQPFQAVFVVSRPVRIALAVLHGATFYLLWRYFNGGYWAGMSVLTLASFVYTQYLYSPFYADRIGRVEVRPNGRAVVFLGGSDTPIWAYPLEGSLVSRYVMLICWQLYDENGERTIRQAVLPGMTDADAYRRLAVWLRYGRHHE